MREGDRIGGYRLLRQIGEGGMGVVWSATHGVLGRRAAIKILRPEYSTQHDTLTRFFNEACAAAAISDPGIIQIFDVGRHNGSAFIVMELLDGETLDSRIKRTGALPVVPALRLCRQVASAIGAAHARGIIHRDLKPENIFVVRDAEVTGGERAKVLDFGIAKLAGNIGKHYRTNTAVVIGTPRYMSPEQCRGAGPVDQRSDIYSLGCVLYALLVGHPPFDTLATGVLIMQHLSDTPAPPSSRAPNVPAEVDALILRCLAKDPAERFESGTELAHAIDELLAMPPVANAPPPVPVVPAIPPNATTLDQLVTCVTPSPVAATTRGRRPGYRRIALAAAAAGIAAITLAGSRVRTESSAATPAPAPITAAKVTAAPVETDTPVDPQPAPARQVDPRVPRVERARADVLALLAAFSNWAASHRGARCPTAAALGAPRDPWGGAYDVTCTDQPADQVIGVRSAGPDGVRDTDDDVVSWMLDDARKLAHGSRWRSAPAKLAPRPSGPPIKPPAKSDDLGDDEIPDSRR